MDWLELFEQEEAAREAAWEKDVADFARYLAMLFFEARDDDGVRKGDYLAAIANDYGCVFAETVRKAINGTTVKEYLGYSFPSLREVRRLEQAIWEGYY